MAGIMQAIGQMSVAIYSHLAVAHITACDVHQTVDVERLQALAKQSHAAAEAYFEGLGVIQRQ